MGDGVRDRAEEIRHLPQEEALQAIRDLGRGKSTEAALVLRELEETVPFPLRKEVRRSLFRLRVAGVYIPEPRSKPAADGPTRAFMSWVDGEGNRLLVVLHDRPSGGARLAKVLVGDDGLHEPFLTECSPRQLGRIMRSWEESETHLVEVPVPYAQKLVAERLSRRVPDDADEKTMLDMVARAIGAPPEEVAHPVYEVLHPLAIKWDPGLLDSCPQLFGEPEMAGWYLRGEGLEKWAQELRNLRNTPLVLDEATVRARLAELERSALSELFTTDTLPDWRRRLEDMAYYFYKRGAEQKARLAAAAALSLDSDNPRSSPFLSALLRRSLEALMQEKKQGEESRIIVPGVTGDARSG